MTADFDTVDYFTDQNLVPVPHPYFDHLRSKCPVVREPNYGVLAITGYDEANLVLKDTDAFSSCIAVPGRFPPLPFSPGGDDITDQITAQRPLMPMFEHMVTMDPPDHTNARSLLNRPLTPRRLKENEDFMWRLADACLGRRHADVLLSGHHGVHGEVECLLARSARAVDGGAGMCSGRPAASTAQRPMLFDWSPTCETPPHTTSSITLRSSSSPESLRSCPWLGTAHRPVNRGSRFAANTAYASRSSDGSTGASVAVRRTPARSHLRPAARRCRRP
jgi:hypothetical protein